MNIGILTHPLQINYGGILQALAMKGVLESLGHSVLILDRRHNLPYWKQFVKYAIDRFESLSWRKECVENNDNKAAFIKRNFNRTSQIHSHKQLVAEIRTKKIDAVVIGSDQVWNPGFCSSRDLDYWGGFLKECDVKVLSYAASMGIPEWNYDSNRTDEIVRFLNKFNGISVRETHLIPVLNKIGISAAKWVLDPTLLKSIEFYEQYIIRNPVETPDQYVFIYWIGDENLIPTIPKEYSKLQVVKCNLADQNNPLTVESWLSHIKNASVVITNSFHGCALSIIFRKHLIPYVHPNYVESRLITLFKKLGLDEKLRDPYCSEDYDSVEKKINKYRSESISFLKNSLS